MGSISTTNHKAAEQRLHLQYTVSRILADSATVNEAGPKILETLARFARWDVGAFWRLDPQQNKLRRAGFWRAPRLSMAEFESAGAQIALAPGEGLPGQVWARQQPIWWQEVPREPGLMLASIAVKAGLKSAFAIPIQFGAQTLAVLEFFSRKVREPSQSMRLTMEALAHQIGQFLDHRRSENQLKESRERYRLILENALEYAIFTLDLDGRVTSWNPGAQRILGFEETEILGRRLDIIFTQDDQVGGRLDLEMGRALTNERSQDERWHVRKDGSPFWASGLMMPLNDEEGRHIGFLKILRDRTGRKQAEELLRESEGRFRQMADAMPQIAWTAKPDGEIDYYNRRWYEFTGLPEGETGVAIWRNVVHPDDIQRCFEDWYDAVRTGKPFQIERRLREAATGDFRWFLTRAVPVRSDKGAVLRWYGTSTDIDDRKRAEQRSMRLNETLVSVLAAIPDVVFVTSVDGRIEFRNAAAENFAHATAVENGLPAPIQNELEQVLNTGEDHLPTGFKTVHRFGIDHDERYYLSRIVGIRSETSQVFGAVVMMQDVTEFRLLDEVKSNLISTVSHELKTPITSLRTALLLVAEQSLGPLNPKQADMLNIARDESERLLRTLNTLLDLAAFDENSLGIRLQVAEPEELIHAAVEETSVAASSGGVTIKLELPPKLPRVKVDRERIIHVLTNLLTNAIKHSAEKSEVIIRAQPQEDRGILFSVVDQGPGVPRQYHSRIFEKFFRVPGGAKKGVGLGLSIAREFVHAHRGRIGVRSEPGKGSEFYFVLPGYTPEPDHSGVHRAARNPHV